MTAYLLFDDPVRSPEMRHEVGEAIVDPVTFVEADGRRILVCSILEEDKMRARDDVVDEVWTEHDLGYDELVKDELFPSHLIDPELVLRAVRRAGVAEAVVPPTFRLQVAEYLRSHGVAVVVDHEAWEMRRRRKTPGELEGIERAQRATDTAMLVAARMLRDADPAPDGGLRFEGEILTAEWLREVMQVELQGQGADLEDIIVHSGDACLMGHDIGSGPILADQSCIIDCFPMDRRTGCSTDMTRTFVPGRASDELKELHRHVRTALDIAFDALRPGRDDAHRKVCDYFHEHGYPTQWHHEGDEPLKTGYFHSLGHGVGLEVHEKPHMGRRFDALVEGDVVAVEPGLYLPGVGGVRLEDTVIVMADGVEHFTEPLPYDLEP